MGTIFKTPLFNLHDVVVIATALSALLMLLIHSISGKKNTLATRALTLFFTCLFANSVGILLLWNNQISIYTANKEGLITTLFYIAHLLKGPALFIYVIATVQSHVAANKKQLWHLIPLFIVLLVLLANNRSITGPLHIEGRLAHDLWLLIRGIPAAYALASITIALQAPGVMKGYYSNEDAIGKNWLSLLCISYAAYWGLTFFTQLFGQSLAGIWSQETADALGIANNYIAFALLVGLFLYSVSVKNTQLAMALNTTKSGSKKPSSKVDHKPVADKISTVMQNNKLYLKMNLNAEQLAEHLEISSRELSTVLNQYFEKNFFEYINGYRVKEAQRLLISDSHKGLTISEILYQSGFNSKSSFQRAFKSLVGMTPSEYKATTMEQPAHLHDPKSL